MLYKIFNRLFQFFLFTILFVLFISSIRVVLNNIKYFGIIKSGKIIDIDYTRGSKSTDERGTYMNTILTEGNKDTVYGGSQNQYKRGDKIKFRFRGIGGNIIFEVNGLKVRSKYDTWDYLSPIILLFSSFMIYKILTHWFIPFLNKIRK